MNFAISIVSFLIPSIAIPAGLSAAASITLLLILLLVHSHQDLRTTLSTLRVAMRRHSYLMAFMLWALVSCVWSPNPMHSLILWCKVFAILAMAMIVIADMNYDLASQYKRIIFLPMTYGLMAGIVIFFIEYLTNGIITNTFYDSQSFRLYKLDRGCALVTVVSWILYYRLGSMRSVILYCILVAMLCLSDSLASAVAIIASSIVLSILKVAKARVRLLAQCCIALIVVAMPIAAYIQDPSTLSDQYLSSIPSAQHRLFIWHFVADNIIHNPIIGYGFDASRYLGDGHVAYFHEYKWSLLPLHPHNNILQILLETGVIGAALLVAALWQLIGRIFDRLVINTNIGLMALCSLASYFIIGMISFGLWQLWWVACGALACVLYAIVASLNPNIYK